MLNASCRWSRPPWPATVPAMCGMSVIAPLSGCENAVNRGRCRSRPGVDSPADVGPASSDPRLGFGIRPCAGQARGRSRLAVPPSRGPSAHRGVRGHARERARGRPRPARRRRLGVPREGLRRAARARASWSAPGARRSRSACAACAWAPTTGSPSPATPRRCWRASRPWCAAASGPRRGSRPARWWPASSRSAPTSSRPSRAARASTSPGASSRCCSCSPRPRARCSSARRSTRPCGATRWPTATARWTCSSARCARSSRRPRPDWSYIHTHFGVGYRFDPEAARPAVAAPAVAEAPETAPEVVVGDRATPL